MTNPTPHGQVPEALIDLIDVYAETRHRCGGIYNAKTEAARKAVIEALSGVQALSAASPPAEQQAAPKAAQVDPDKLMRDCLALLESFDYEDDEDSQSKAFFNAHINADWFFHVKHSIERQLEAKWGTQPQAGAVPQGWKAVPVNPTPEMWKAAKSVPDPNPPYPPHYGLVWDAMLAASPTPTAEQQAQPGAVGRTGCTAGTDEECTRRGCATSCPAQQAAPKAAPGEQNTVPAEWLEQAYREGWAACRDAETIGEEAEDWAFGNSTANSRMIDAQQAAPQQEAQEPVAWLNPWRADQVTTDYDAYGERGIPLYTAPQPAPTAQAAESVQEDAARLDWLEQNLFHREKDEWDTKYGGYKEYNMWVLFSPKGIQGSARNIIDAAREQGADHDR